MGSPVDHRVVADRGSVGSRDAVPLLAAGGLLGAVIASSCCLLPVTLSLLGLGGAWLGLFAPLAPFQPVFASLAAACLGAGFWLALRPTAACGAEGPCEVGRTRWPARLALGLGTLVLLAVLAFEPLILPLLIG